MVNSKNVKAAGVGAETGEVMSKMREVDKYCMIFKSRKEMQLRHNLDIGAG